MKARPMVHGVLGLAIALAQAGCSNDSGEERDDTDANAETGAGGTQSGSPSAPPIDADASNGSDPLSQEPFPPSDRSVRPSAGCALGTAAPPAGTQMLSTGGVMGRYYVNYPRPYDPARAHTLVFAFHGANNDEFACRAGGNCPGVQPALEGEVIVIYPKSFGTSWTGPERDQNVTYFDDLLAHAKATYCIDERKVVALGTSSGAHFSNILGCRRGDQLLAIIPGAGERLETSGCRGLFAALVIHGVDDTSVPFQFGEQARDFYRMQNGCSETTVPELAAVHAQVRAARDAGEETYACVDYQGCMDGLPVRWCEHSEGGYDNSTHGFPVAGGASALEFINSL